MNNAFVSLRLLPAVEEVGAPFKIAAERITVPAGHYDMMVGQFSIDTPPRRTLEGHLGYTTGSSSAGIGARRTRASA